MVVPNHIIEDEGKKQKQDAQEGKKKGAGQGCQAGKTVDVGVVIENGIKQYPAGGYDQGAEEKFGVIQHDERQGSAFRFFAKQKE